MTALTLNGVSIIRFTVVNNTTIVFSVPAGSTTGFITATATGGTAVGPLFTVILPPGITSMSPASGPAGTVVTITGADLTGVNSLTLNGVAITGFTVVNNTTITFTVPIGATSGNVVVTNAAGSSAGVLFTVTTTTTATTRANETVFSVWPNPVAGQGTLHIALATATAKATVTLRTVLGQTVVTRTFSGSTADLATTGLAAGTYLLTVQTEGRAPSVQRVVVQ